jgi:biotin carboxylase
MKKILILGGSHRDIPLIQAAQELNYHVTTVGNRDFYKGHDYADNYYKIDFNELDTITEIIKNNAIDFIVPGCGEVSYLNSVKLAQTLHIGNFDSWDVAQTVHNKWKFKQFCLKHNICTPKGSLYTNSLDISSFSFPVITKPTNLSAGQGVSIATTIEEFKSTIKTAKNHSEEIFVEEYIEGELVAYSIILKDKKVAYGFQGKDDTFLNPYLVSTAYPISFSPTVLEKLNHDIEKLAKLLPLVNGMFHLQVIVKEEKPYIIDVTRRIPGELYPKLIEYCDNINYSKAVVEAYTTGEITQSLDVKKQKFVIRHVVMPHENGLYQDMFIDKKIEKFIKFSFGLIDKQTQINDFLHTQISIIFLEFPEHETQIIQNINSLIYPIVEKSIDAK